MSSGLKIADFLHHTTRSEKKKYLSGWKKSETHSVNIWLHTKSDIYPIWRHQFPDIAVIEDRDTGEKRKEVWTRQYVCYEPEIVLKNQNRRDRETGERIYPPTRCPMCLFIEKVRELVDLDELDITKPLFNFEGSKDSRILHAGGIYNGFSGNLDDATKAQIKKAGIKPMNAWQENMVARLNYVFSVVDDDDLDAGAQVAIESSLLGDKVKRVIGQTLEQLGVEDGDIVKHPYAIRWMFNPKEGIPFNEKYDAMMMPKIAYRPAVKKLIVDDEAPQLDSLLEKFNRATIKARWQQHALVPFAWESFFPEGVGSEGNDPETKVIPAVHVAPKEISPSVPSLVEEELVACDTCETPMKVTDAKCLKCGHVYIEEAKPAPALKKRSEVVTKPTEVKVKGWEPNVLEDSEDELPF